MEYFQSTLGETIQHDCDCMIHGFGICTCGLLHELTLENDPNKIYPKYDDEQDKQNNLFIHLLEYRGKQE